MLNGGVVVAMSWRDKIARFLGLGRRTRPDGVKALPADDIDQSRSWTASSAALKSATLQTWGLSSGCHAGSQYGPDAARAR
jgi:hypothetical protein